MNGNHTNNNNQPHITLKLDKYCRSTRWLDNMWVIWFWRLVLVLRYFVIIITHRFPTYSNLVSNNIPASVGLFDSVIVPNDPRHCCVCHWLISRTTLTVLINSMIVFFILKSILIYIWELILQSPAISAKALSTSRTLIWLNESNVVRIVAQLRIPLGVSDVLAVKTISVAQF